MRLHRKTEHVGITSIQWLPWIDWNGRVQYYILWENYDFFLFQDTAWTYLINLDAIKLERVKQELKIEGGEVIDIGWKERQYWSHSWYALELPNDWRDWFHVSRRRKIQWILTKVQGSVEWSLWKIQHTPTLRRIEKNTISTPSALPR